jgi:hypothetical protein
MTTTCGRLSSQASAAWAGLTWWASATCAQRSEQRCRPDQVLRAEQRVGRPYAARAMVHGVPPAEQALRQRAVGDHDAVRPLGKRHEVLERLRVGQ